MKKALVVMLAVVLLFGCVNNYAKDEKKAEWIVLFDGTSTDAWRGMNSETFPASAWRVEEDALVFTPGQKDSRDIITKAEFSDFVFELEFKLTEAANSGIKYFVVEEMSKGKGALGLEYQVLDDEKHPDAKAGRDFNHNLASLYDLITADKNKPVKPIGQWNTVRIVSKGSHVEHWLNGAKVVEFDRASQEFKDLIAISKYKNIKDFGLAPKGHIALQDHGDKVYYRNIRIQVLDDDK